MRFSSISSSKNMNDKKSTSILILAALAFVFMFASILVFSELVKYQKKAMSAAEEDALWASYQLDKELIKLKTSLQFLEKSYSQENLENSKFNFDILYSRINVLGAGRLKDLFSRSSDFLTIFDSIRAKADRMDRLLFTDDKVDASFLLKENEALIDEAGDFISNALAARAIEKEENRNNYHNLIIYLGGLIGLLTFTVMFIVYILFKQLRIVERSYEESRELTEKLENAVISSEKALKVKSDFVATMSHEIRTPMNAIIGFSYLLMNSNVPEKHKDKIHSIQKAADGLLAIINNILDFSKIESGKIEIEKKSFNIDNILEYVYEINKTDAKNKGLNFTIHRDFPMNDFLIGDATRLQQIFINLISNAIKFTQVGSIIVRVYTNHEGKFVFEVNDTGIGIREGVNVFDVFKQADTSTTRLYGGTGLGLSITQKLVHLLGGRVSYKSTENKGSQFLVELPYLPDLNKPSSILECFSLIKEDSAILKLLDGLAMDRFVIVDSEEFETYDGCFLVSEDFIKSNIHALGLNYLFKYDKFFLVCKKIDFKDKNLEFDFITPSNLYDEFIEMSKIDIKKTNEKNEIDGCISFEGKTVLLAEDNKVNANIVMAILNKIKVSVDWVENGEDACKKSASNHYDLIIMDIRMPIMDGYQASEKIHYALKDKKPPIIVLTADVISIHKDSFKNSFFDDVLFKPLDSCAFIKIVGFWLGNKNFNKIYLDQVDDF